MAITIPQLDRLKAQLLTSGLSQKDQPLFQIINQLIDALRQGITELEGHIVTITNNIAPPSTVGVIITNRGLISSDEGFNEGMESVMMIPGPSGSRGPIGLMGPPGLDGVCDECSCMPFVGSILIP